MDYQLGKVGFITGIFIVMSMFAQVGFAQTEDLNVRDPRLQEGKMFTVKLSPASKQLVVSFVGKPQVELGPDRVMVFGRERLAGGQYRKLKIRPTGSQFQIMDSVDL